MVVPKELEKLSLYAADPKLCERWAELLPAWKEAYPGVDIMGEVAKAHAWEVANPERRKVQRGRFLTKWLARAQDRGYRSYQRQAPAATPVTDRDLMIQELNQYKSHEVKWHGEIWVISPDGVWNSKLGFRLYSTMVDGDIEAILKAVKEVKIAHDLERRIQEANEKAPQVLPQPEVRSDGGRDYF